MAAESPTDARVTELVREGLSRKRRPLTRRRAVTEVVVGGTYVAAAILLAVLGDRQQAFDTGPAVLLVGLFAVAIRFRIDVGVTYTAPVQLAFVPMLFLVPTADVPLLVLLAWTLGTLPDLWGRDPIHPDRLLLVPGNCWFAIGPALVLIAGDAQTADWDKWPVYLAAVGAQFVADNAVSVLREWLGEGVGPGLQVRTLALVSGIDALLSPLGLLAAFASESWRYAFLLLMPPAFLITLYVGERSRSLDRAMALADAARDREDLIAGASHELVTPLGVLVGLTGRLTKGSALPEARRTELDAVMRREVLLLRQIVRQFVDYTRLKTERDLQLRPAPTYLTELAQEIAGGLASSGAVTVEAEDDLPAALVDADRAHQMLTSIAAEALEGSDAVVLRITAGSDTVIVTAVSPQAPRERPFAEGGEGSNAGLGLYVTRELARMQGGDLEAEAGPETGARYVLTLPRAQ